MDRNEVMDEKELSLVVWSWGILLGAVGSLIVLSGGLLSYLFKQHRSHNYSEHIEIKESLENRVTELKQDIKDVHHRIDEVLMGE